jgi:hypothetical protein
MKRYKIHNIDFDTRATILNLEINNDWEDKVKRLWTENKQNIIKSLIFEFGEYDQKSKLNNFIDIGAKPFSILAFHNIFFHQIRNSFVMGAYYPALTGVCALGERILNHLILKLREYHKSFPEYKYIYRKDSFDDWDIAINALSNWNVLLPEVKENFEKLKIIRNDNIHFNYETDYNDRNFALNAIREMNEIISKQFAAGGEQPWIIQNTKGSFYIKKEYEQLPFIKEIYLPNCVYVGPQHKIHNKNGTFIVEDDFPYDNIDITDEEFVRLGRLYNTA